MKSYIGLYLLLAFYIVMCNPSALHMMKHYKTLDIQAKTQNIVCLNVQAGKTLFVPTPGMSNHILSKLSLPEKHTKRSLRTTVTRQGVMELSEPVDMDCVVPMDLVIAGSVAVSLTGIIIIIIIIIISGCR